MKAVIMEGGRGTRIAAVDGSVSKPMIRIEDLPVLEWETRNLREQGFRDIILTVLYRTEQIIDYFGNGGKFGIHIEYFREDKPLGNAGALFKLRVNCGTGWRKIFCF